MALTTVRAAPLQPEIKLSQVPSKYEAFISPEQKSSFGQSPPDPTADGAHMSSRLLERSSEKSSIIELVHGCHIFKFSGNVHRGGGYELREHWEFDCRDVLGRVKMTIQLGSTLGT